MDVKKLQHIEEISVRIVTYEERHSLVRTIFKRGVNVEIK
jgi:hypothetical protein